MNHSTEPYYAGNLKLQRASRQLARVVRKLDRSVPAFVAACEAATWIPWQVYWHKTAGIDVADVGEQGEGEAWLNTTTNTRT